MNIIILADKYDKGMKSKGCQGLLPYNSRTTIIEQQFKTLSKLFHHFKIIYVYGLAHKKLLAFIETKPTLNKLSLVYNEDYEYKNDIYSLYLSKNLINTKDGLLIIHGTTVPDATQIKRLNRKESSCFVDKTNNNQIGCIYQDEQITNIDFDLNTSLNNIYYIAAKDVEIFLSLISDRKNHNCFVFEVLNKMIDYKTNIGLIC